jgi:hypothetical protein
MGPLGVAIFKVIFNSDTVCQDLGGGHALCILLAFPCPLLRSILRSLALQFLAQFFNLAAQVVGLWVGRGRRDIN